MRSHLLLALLLALPLMLVAQQGGSPGIVERVTLEYNMRFMMNQYRGASAGIGAAYTVPLPFDVAPNGMFLNQFSITAALGAGNRYDWNGTIQDLVTTEFGLYLPLLRPASWLILGMKPSAAVFMTHNARSRYYASHGYADAGIAVSAGFVVSSALTVSVEHRWANIMTDVDKTLIRSTVYQTVGFQLSWSPWRQTEHYQEPKLIAAPSQPDSLPEREKLFLSIGALSAATDSLRFALRELRALNQSPQMESVSAYHPGRLPEELKADPTIRIEKEGLFDGRDVRVSQDTYLKAVLSVLSSYEPAVWRLSYRDPVDGKARARSIRKFFEVYNSSLTGRIDIPQSAEPHLTSEFELTCLGVLR